MGKVEDEFRMGLQLGGTKNLVVEINCLFYFSVHYCGYKNGEDCIGVCFV